MAARVLPREALASPLTTMTALLGAAVVLALAAGPGLPALLLAALVAAVALSGST